MELARGIEPPTCGLQNRCSAIELRQPEGIGLQTHPDTLSENITTAYEPVKRTRGVPGACRISVIARISTIGNRRVDYAPIM